jgi:hypothetical protein
MATGLLGRVARWYIFLPKIPIWVTLGEMNGKCWYILWPFGIFYGKLIYKMAFWYILWLFGILFPVLFFCSNKNLATLLLRPRVQSLV